MEEGYNGSSWDSRCGLLLIVVYVECPCKTENSGKIPVNIAVDPKEYLLDVSTYKNET